MQLIKALENASKALFTENSQRIVRIAATWIAIASYGVALVMVFLERRGFELVFSHLTPTSYLGAIAAPLTVLLVYELYLLVLAFRKSVVDFLQKQFEVVALLIVRDIFKYIGQYGSDVFSFSSQNIRMLLALIGVLGVYGLLEYLERFEARYATAELQREARSITSTKNILALPLLLWVGAVTAYYLYGGALGLENSGLTKQYFETIFTVLLIADIFILLLTLSTKERFSQIFEYSLFTLASVGLRLALPLSTLEKTVVTAGAVLLTMAVVYLHRFVNDEDSPREA